MSKHAYLVMAHGNFKILEYLLRAIDDVRNDIFLHVDARNRLFDEELCRTWVSQSRLYVIPRQDVYWADYSIVDVTMKLIQEAKNIQSYKYYHLISGVDMPLKTQEEIHEYFQKKDDEFIGVVPTDKSWYATKRVKFYYFFINNSIYRKCKPLKLITRILVQIQRLFKVDRLKGNSSIFTDGWQWFSITDKFVQYLISKKDYIYKTFSKTLSSDELFIQTIAFNTEFKDKIHDLSSLSNSSKRYIDWKRGKPYTFRYDDFEELMNSNCFFARKFDEKVDMKIVDKIYQTLRERQEKEDD